MRQKPGSSSPESDRYDEQQPLPCSRPRHTRSYDDTGLLCAEARKDQVVRYDRIVCLACDLRPPRGASEGRAMTTTCTGRKGAGAARGGVAARPSCAPDDPSGPCRTHVFSSDGRTHAILYAVLRLLETSAIWAANTGPELARRVSCQARRFGDRDRASRRSVAGYARPYGLLAWPHCANRYTYTMSILDLRGYSRHT